MMSCYGPWVSHGWPLDFQSLLKRFCALAAYRNLRHRRCVPTVTLQAHFDGHRIVLDEPYDLPTNTHLMVTVLPSSPDPDTEEAWLRTASASEAFAFLADPGEDIYTVADGEPFRDAT